MDRGLQNAIQSFDPSRLKRAETVDKSGPYGVADQDRSGSPPNESGPAPGSRASITALLSQMYGAPAAPARQPSTSNANPNPNPSPSPDSAAAATDGKRSNWSSSDSEDEPSTMRRPLLSSDDDTTAKSRKKKDKKRAKESKKSKSRSRDPAPDAQSSNDRRSESKAVVSVSSASDHSANSSPRSDTDQQKKKKKKDKKNKKNGLAGLRNDSFGKLTDLTLSIEEQENGNEPPPLMGFLFLLAFLSSLDFSIILPSLYPLVEAMDGSQMYYAWIFSSYNLAQLLSSLVLNYWIERRPIIEILLSSSLLMISGHAVYFSATPDPDHSNQLWMLLFGRVLCGLGSGISIVAYAHVARHTPKESRPARIVALRWVENLGSMMAPALGALSIKLHFLFFRTIEDFNVSSFVLCLLICVYTILLIASTLGWYRRKKAWDITEIFGKSLDNENARARALLERERGQNSIVNTLTPSQTLALVCTFLLMVVAFWAYEAALIPATRNQDWSLLENYLLFCYIGGMLCLSFAFYKFSNFKENNTKVLVCSIVLMIAGFLFLTVYHESIPTWQVVVSAAFIVSGYTIGTAQLPSIYARFISNEVQDDVASKMTWLFWAVAVARSLGPIWGVAAYQIVSINLVTMSCSGLLLIALLIATLFVTKSQVGYSSDIRTDATRVELLT